MDACAEIEKLKDIIELLRSRIEDLEDHIKQHTPDSIIDSVVSIATTHTDVKLYKIIDRIDDLNSRIDDLNNR